MPQSDCLTVARPLTVPSSATSRASESGRVLSPSVSSPSAQPPSTEVDRKAMSRRLSTSSSIVWWMLALSPSSRAFIPPVPRCTRSDVASAVSSAAAGAPSSPIVSVPCQAVTWSSRSCPAFAAAPPRRVCTESVALSGPNRWVPGSITKREHIARSPDLGDMRHGS